MKFYIKAFLCALIYVAGALCLFSQRTLPVSKIWNNYTVVYVSNSLTEEEALNVLEKNGCRKVVALSRQCVPSVNSILPVEKETSSYLQERLKYFSDKNGKFRIFYVPSLYEKNAVKAVNELTRHNKTAAGMDFQKKYPWAVPVVCCVIFGILFYFSPERLIFALCGLFPVLLSFACPMYPVGEACVLLMTAIFLAARVWDRKDGLKCLLKSPYFIILTASAEIIGFVDSVKSLVILLIMDAVLAGMLFLFKSMKKDWDEMHSFRYEKILTARAFPLMTSRNSKILIVTEVPMLLFLILFSVSAFRVPEKSSSGVMLPVPSSEMSSDEMLPVAMDYYRWYWEKATFPYRNLNEKNSSLPVKKGDEIKVKRFLQNGAEITETEEVVMTFDDSFIQQCQKSARETENPSIEEFLINQKEDIHVKYNESAKVQAENQTIGFALILSGMVIPLVLCACYMLTGKRRYENSK